MLKSEIKNLIKKSNPVIFEIGCADGIDTQEFIEEFGPDITLHCFEPDPRNIGVFLNGGERVCKPHFTGPVLGNNIFLNQKAVGNEDGKIVFYQTTTIYSSSLKEPNENLKKTWPEIDLKDKLEIDCIKLDTYVDENKIEMIDFIWADVQGAEDLMKMGGKETFKNRVKYLYTEYSKDESNSFYRGTPFLNDILSLLGEGWSLERDFGPDVLLRNNNI
jgi:FkbM family methyltransferase